MRRIELQVERGRLDGLLFVAGRASEAVKVSAMRKSMLVPATV